MLFVSYKLEEVFAVCDTVAVLRDGEGIIESAPLLGYKQQDIVAAMVGRQLARRDKRFREVLKDEPVFRLNNVVAAMGHPGASLDLHQGEVLGLYGLVGAGRSELMRSVLGLHTVISGDILARQGHQNSGRPRCPASLPNGLRDRKPEKRGSFPRLFGQ